MNVTILVVDDEEMIRNMLSRHFRFKGYNVLTAENGREALDVLKNNKVDVMITDIMMPEMNGIELLREVRDEYPMMKSIVITGYVTLENALACLRNGADTFVLKPIVDITVLEKAVERATETIQRWFDLLKQLRGIRNRSPGEAG